jgi:hypothetical protein
MYTAAHLDRTGNKLIINIVNQLIIVIAFFWFLARLLSFRGSAMQFRCRTMHLESTSTTHTPQPSPRAHIAAMLRHPGWRIVGGPRL